MSRTKLAAKLPLNEEGSFIFYLALENAFGQMALSPAINFTVADCIDPFLHGTLMTEALEVNLR